MKITSTLIMIATVAIGFSFASNHSEATDSMVSAGGNETLWDKFTPQNVTINVGESVTWRNPMAVSEPHSVTYVPDPEYFAPFLAPFSISNSTKLKSLVPNPNIEPNVIDLNGTRAVIVDNSRSTMPVAIDSGGNATYLPINSKYTMDGSEKYVNSGWMWPQGQSPPGAPPISNFSITFEKSGTYSYLCSVHPWMTGTVTVS